MKYPCGLTEIHLLLQFLFTLFADAEKDPPLLDYTEMLLYFASHPNPVEGVYRALSVATGTHIHRKKERIPPDLSVVNCSSSGDISC